MKYIDLTLPTPQHNLACDEALLDWCEAGFNEEILRFWEPHENFVVLGYSSKTKSEVNLPFCREYKVPVLRRCSGGGTVLQGPGCLNYSVILRIGNSSPLKSITETNHFIMQCLEKALTPILGTAIGIQGFSDLAIGGLKFSGNAQHRKRRFLLFHGTFLLQFDIALIEKLLPIPVKQPSYRQNRRHKDFLTNLHLPSALIKDTLETMWHANESLKYVPSEEIDRLVRKRYSKHAWNFKF